MKNKAVANLFMRASTWNGHTAGNNISMPKLNGLRCMYNPLTKTFWSRDGVLWKPKVLAHLELPQDVKYPLDGELYCHGMTLQEITRAVAAVRHEPGPRANEIQFHVFDALIPEEYAIERRKYLFSLEFTDTVRHLRGTLCESVGQLDECYNKYIEQGYEGQMIKPCTGHYIPQGEFKRATINLQKRKDFLDDEFICVNITAGAKRLEGSVGALVFKTQSGIIFEVGTGFDDVERLGFLRQPPIGRKATIKYLNLTEDGKPFNASFVGWRD